MTTTTFNPSNILDGSLSNGNLTFTSSATDGQVVGSTNKTSGKLYFEITPNSAISGNAALGVVANGDTYVAGTESGSTNLCYLLAANGEILSNGSAYLPVFEYATQTVQVAIDIDNALIWFSIDNTTWSDVTTPTGGDPGTGVGGIPIVVGTGLAIIAFLTGGNVATLATETGSLVHTPPTGFSAWDAPVALTGVWASTEAADAMSITGFSVSPGPTGNFTATETPDSFVAAGFAPVTISFAISEVSDHFSAFITQPLDVIFNATEKPDIFVGAGLGLGEDGTFNVTELADIFSAFGSSPVSGVFNTTEATDRFSAIGSGVTRVRRRRSVFVT